MDKIITTIKRVAQENSQPDEACGAPRTQALLGKAPVSSSSALLAPSN